MSKLTVLIPNADVNVSNFMGEIKGKYKNELFWEFPENGTHPANLRKIACLIANNLASGNRISVLTYSFDLIREINTSIIVSYQNNKSDFIEERKTLMERYGYLQENSIPQNQVEAFALKVENSILFYEPIEVNWSGIVDTTLDYHVSEQNERSDMIRYGLIDFICEDKGL